MRREASGVRSLTTISNKILLFTTYISRLAGSQKGMALLMTILIVTLLSMLIIDTNSRSYLAVTRAKNSANGLKAYYIMKSGVSAAQAFLEIDARNPQTNTVDTLSEDWARGIKGFPVGDGVVSIDIIDESSKFNINTLVNAQGTINPENSTAIERFDRLLRGLGLDGGLALRVATWVRDNRKDFSYAFRDTSELMLVKDFTPEAFNKVKSFVTTYTVRGNNNININTVSPQVLNSLSPVLTEGLVAAIIDYRKEHPIMSTGDLKKIQGIDDVILSSFSNALTTTGQSSYFTVLAEAKVSDTIRKGVAVLNRSGSAIKILAWKEE